MSPFQPLANFASAILKKSTVWSTKVPCDDLCGESESLTE